MKKLFAMLILAIVVGTAIYSCTKVEPYPNYGIPEEYSYEWHDFGNIIDDYMSIWKSDRDYENGSWSVHTPEDSLIVKMVRTMPLIPSLTDPSGWELTKHYYCEYLGEIIELDPYFIENGRLRYVKDNVIYNAIAWEISEGVLDPDRLIMCHIDEKYGEPTKFRAFVRAY